MKLKHKIARLNNIKHLNPQESLPSHFFSSIAGTFFTALVMISCQAPLKAALTVINWQGPGNDWNTASNWSPATVPNTINSQAHFINASITTVNIFNSFTINSLFFDTTASNYTLMGAFPAGSGLIFTTAIDTTGLPSIPPTINVQAGTQTIQAAGAPGSGMGLALVNGTTVTVAQNAVLNLSNIQMGQQGGYALSLIGPGTLNNTNGSSITTLSSTGTITIDGTITLVNDGLNTTFGFASLLNMNSGTFTNQNNAGVTAVGVFNINGGTFTNTGFGTTVSNSSLNLTGGTLNNQTDASISLSNFSMTGGSFINQDSATLSSTGNFIVSAGSVTNQTNASIESTPLVIFSGGTILNQTGAQITSITTLNLAGATLSNSVDGLISNIVNFNFQSGALNNNGSISSAITNYNMSSPSLYNFGIQNVTNFGYLQATNLNLSGTLELTPLSGFFVPIGTPLTILSGTASRTGEFSSFIYPPSLQPLLAYVGNEVLLSFGPPTMAGYVGGLAETVFASIDHINNYIRHGNPRFKDNCAYQNHFEPYELSATLAGLGIQGASRSTGQQVGFDYFTTGAVTSLEYTVPQLGFGVLVSYESTHGNGEPPASIDVRWGKFYIQDLHGSAYFSFNPSILDSLFFNGIIGGSYEWLNIQRSIADAIAVSGDCHGKEWDCLGSVECSIDFGCMSFTPFASLQYIYWSMNGYEETGSLFFDLSINGQTAHSLRSQVGASFAVATAPHPQGIVFLSVDLGWQREYLDHNRSLFFTPVYITSPGETIEILGGERNTFIASLNLSLITGSCISVESGYDYEKNALFWDQSLYLAIKAQF